MSATLSISTAARMIHKNAPDDLRAQGKEMHTGFAANASRAKQFHIRLVCQGRGFERLIRAAAPEMLPGYTSQLGVNHRYEIAKRLIIAVRPGNKQPADVLGTIERHDGC